MTKQQGAGMPDVFWIADSGIILIFPDGSKQEIRMAITAPFTNDAPGTKYLRADLATPAPEIEGLEDLGDELAWYLKDMYPGAYKAMPEGMKRSLRNWLNNKTRAYASQSKADAWQPIETAPKKAPVPPVDLWFPSPDGGYRMSDCYWFGEYWSQIGNGGKPLGQMGGEPTHWMPLPAPPKGADNAN